MKTCAGKHAACGWEAGEGRVIHTGEASGFFVVDTDSAEADTWLAAQGLPATFTVRSGSGRGHHRYFAMPAFPVGNSTSKIAPKIDVRGDGGVIVAPGSPHAAGGTYKIVDASPIAAPPSWLLAKLQETSSEKRDARYVEAVPLTERTKEKRLAQARAYLSKTAPLSIFGEGGRDTAFTVACVLVRRMLLPTQAAADLWEEVYNPRLREAGTRTWTREAERSGGRSIVERLESARHTGSTPAGNATTDADLDFADRHASSSTPAASNDNAAPAARAKTLGVVFGGWHEEPPPVEFLVEGLLPRASVSKWFGHADSLKTWILFSLAIAVSKGEPWLGRYPTTQGRVVIVDFETGTHNVRRRLFMLGAGNNEFLGSVSYPGRKTSDPKLWEELAKLKPALVIVDSLRAGNPGANENDSDEAIAPLLVAGQFAETSGAAVAFVHHAKKDSGGAVVQRGSAAIKDQVDCAFAVKADKGTEAQRQVTVECEKPGDMKKPADVKIDFTFDDVRKTARASIAGGDARQEQRLDTDLLQALLSSQGPFSSEEALRKDLGWGMSRLRSAWKTLEGEGRAVLVAGKRQVDSKERRVSRVLAAAKESYRTGRKLTPKDLAKTAAVFEHEVLEQEKAGRISRQSASAKASVWSDEQADS